MLASCILQCGNLCSASDMVDKITLKKWKIIGEQEKNGLVQIDNFKSVCTTVEWKLGSTGLFMHDSCYIKLASLRKLTQTENVKKNSCRTQQLRTKAVLIIEQPQPMTTSPLRNLNVLTVPILFMTSQNVFSVSRNQTKSTQEFQTIPYFFTPNVVLFQTSYHFIKR